MDSQGLSGGGRVQAASHHHPLQAVLQRAPQALASFRSDDLDEVRAYMDRHTGAHWRRAMGPAPLGFEMALLASPGAKMAWHRCAGAQAVRGSVFDPTIQLSLAGEATYRIGRREVTVPAGGAMLLAPQADVTIVTRALHRFVVALPAAALEQERAARRRDAPDDRLVAAQSLAIDAGAMAELGRVAKALVGESSRDPSAAARSEARLVAWFADRLAREPDGRRTPALADARVREVEAWIEDHLHKPITLGRLCEVAGVGARCLQIAFERRRRMSPMDFVATRRIEAAHAKLVSGDAPSVTAVALALGIEHLGRFSIAYRRLYGLSPSETLAIARRR